MADIKNIEDLKEEILELIVDVTDTDVKRKDVDASFVEGVNVDSLMALEIVSALEKKYNIEIEEGDLPKLGTIDDMVVLVDRLLQKSKGKKIIRKNLKPAKQPLKITRGRKKSSKRKNK